jgi:hypothetical protein
VIRTGTWNEAPWQPLAELELIETPLRTTMVFVPLGIEIARPEWVGTVTPEVAPVQLLPPDEATLPFCETLMSLSE